MKKIYIVHSAYADEFIPFAAFTSKDAAEKHRAAKESANPREDYEIGTFKLYEGSEVPMSTIIFYDRWEQIDGRARHTQWNETYWDYESDLPHKSKAKIIYQRSDQDMIAVTASGHDQQEVQKLALKKFRNNVG